jgi:hypothetical protein
MDTGSGQHRSEGGDEHGAAPFAGAKKRRLGPLGYLRAIWLARTAAVTWPEAKEMALRNEPDPDRPVDVVADSERRRHEPSERRRDERGGGPGGSDPGGGSGL